MNFPPTITPSDNFLVQRNRSPREAAALLVFCTCDGRNFEFDIADVRALKGWASVRSRGTSSSGKAVEIPVENLSTIYRLTDSGKKARWQATAGLLAEHRCILDLIESDTHFDVICGWLRQHSDAVLAGWLSELESMGYVSAAPAGPEHDLDFTGYFASAKPRGVQLAQADATRVLTQAKVAGNALNTTGAYLSVDRLKNRVPLEKSAGQTVVLIVEDDPDQAALAERRLGIAGYPVRLACSRKELIEDLQGHPLPDLVLLDVMLPDGDGFEILSKIRRHPRLALLPVVMLTAMVKAEDIQKGLRLGADGYITKPYAKSTLPETIRQVLKHA